ncbi:MAG: tetratricopeptide repeat protein, partial [Gammaproteobacteria bacterium]|nr:tetratricopeptide repeat protein [Gammaproteobacteria bacterium]
MHPNKIKKQSLGELLDKAWDCIARNNLTQAKKYIDMASSSEPDNVRVRFFSGVLEYKKQNYLKSISILQALLDEYPTHGDAHVNIGSAYSESGMLDKAEYHYRKALELRPDDHIALNNLAGLCRKQMRLAEAQMLFNKSIEIEPNFWQSHFNLGGLFIARKMISKSVDHFRAAFKLNKNSNTYASLIGSLKHDYFEEANELAKEVASFKKPDFSILSAFPILVHSCEWEIVDKIQDKVLKVACAEQRYANWVQSILLPLNKLHDVSREDVFKVHKAWGNMMHRPKDAYIEHKKAMKPSAHINIGYLSADFREHSVGHFIRNIISNHDKTRFKIFCYATYSKEDEITKEIRSYSTSYAQVH